MLNVSFSIFPSGYEPPGSLRRARWRPHAAAVRSPVTRVFRCSWEVDRQLGLTRSVSRYLGDARRQASWRASSTESAQAARICAGPGTHEDLNDHGELRHDPALQTAAFRMETLASPSTVCRLEQRANRETAVALHQALFDQFVGAQATVL